MEVLQHTQSVKLANQFMHSATTVAGTANPGTANEESNPATITTASQADSLSIGKSVVVQQVVTQQVSIALNVDNTVTTTSNNADRLVSTVLDKFDSEVKEHADNNQNDDHHGDDQVKAEVARNISLKVDYGFSQATSVLARMGMLDKGVENNVEQNRQQVQQAVSDAAAPASSQQPEEQQPGLQQAEGVQPVPVGEGLAVQPGTEINTASFNAAATSRSLSSSLQVTTSDGDVVSIDLSRSRSFSAASLETASSSVAFAGASSTSQMSISVQGELSEKESESIKAVVERVNEMAKKLLHGKTGAALEKMSELNVDPELLANISLNMSSSITYAAVSAYAQVSEMPVDSAGSADVAAVPASGSEGIPSASGASSASGEPVVSATSGTEIATGEASTDQAVADTSAGQTAVEATQEVAADAEDLANTVDFQNPFMEIRKIFEAIFDGIGGFDVGEDHESFIKQLFSHVIDRLDSSESGDVHNEIESESTDSDHDED